MTLDTQPVELKPCPWCNGPADIGEDDGTHEVVFGFCTQCCAQGPYDADNNREEAARLWNERALEARIPQEDELTDAMIDAGKGAWLDHRGFSDRDVLTAIYKAMSAAMRLQVERP